jgi:hypothetical protein
VKIGADNRITSIGYVYDWQVAPLSKSSHGQSIVHIEMSDYGIPVTVEVPSPLIGAGR